MSNSDFEPPHTNGAVHQSGITEARRLRRRLFLGGGLLLAAAWIFAIVWSVTVNSSSPERMDRAAADAVSAACAATQQQLRAIPNPFPRLGADRIARIRAEDARLRAMTLTFQTVHPRSKSPAKALARWTTDWTHVIESRERYADDLLKAKGTDKVVKLVLPGATALKPVTSRMDDFVRENHPDLDACFTRALQLEVVEGQRTYEKLTSS